MQQQWREYLKGNLDWRELRGSGHAQPDNYRKFLLTVRRNAIKALTDLVFIYGNMQKATDDPDRQFEMIFPDERFTSFFRVAKQEQLRRWLPRSEQTTEFALRLTIMGVDFDLMKLYRDTNYRVTLDEELGKKLKKSGMTRADLEREIEYRKPV